MIGLNHSFVATLMRGAPEDARAAFHLVEHVRRRTKALPLVHPSIGAFVTEDGTLLSWARRLARDTDRAPIVRLLLGTMSGPFLPEPRFEGSVEPSLETLEGWLEDAIRRLLGAQPANTPTGLVSPTPTGGADSPRYASTDASTERFVSNWLDASAFDNSLSQSVEGESAVDVLRAAEQAMGGRLVVLPAAARAAEHWNLDCSAQELHRALLGLETFADALVEGLSREQAAKHYHQCSTIPMSQESAATWKSPPRRRQRMFVAGDHGEQYFDMHAKPGKMTRVHIWVYVASDGSTTIYVGHCGRHLD